MADVIILTPFEGKIVQIKKCRRWVGLGTAGRAGGKACQAASHVLVRGRGGGVTAPCERQTGSQAEKGFCCSNVTETLGVCCVCCPTFGMPVHMKNTQGQEEAEEVAPWLGSVHWLRLSWGNCSCIFNKWLLRILWGAAHQRIPTWLLLRQNYLFTFLTEGVWGRQKPALYVDT